MKPQELTRTWIAIFCFGLFQTANAVVPTPDGCYPNFTTAEGCDALHSLTTGTGNTGIGWRSLFLNTDSSFNTGVGGGTLVLNNGSSNTAVGAAALLLNTTGTENTAVGTDALVYNDSGSSNSAFGAFALFNNTGGELNTAVGHSALQGNTLGFANTAVGYQALMDNSGNGGPAGNTALGYEALMHNTTGVDNVACGALALLNVTTGSRNTALGEGAGMNLTTGSGNIDIGNAGETADVSTIRIGTSEHMKAFIGGIRGVTTGVANAIPVLIDFQNQLGTMSSSRRYKKDIQPMEQASEIIHALKPVTFHYKTDSTGTPQFGLIAEEVAEVNPDLVVRDDSGEIYTVRYDAVNAMLLNEFLKAHKLIDEQQTTIAQLKKDVQTLVARIEEQTAKIQRVSEQIEIEKASPQLASSDLD